MVHIWIYAQYYTVCIHQCSALQRQNIKVQLNQTVHITTSGSTSNYTREHLFTSQHLIQTTVHTNPHQIQVSAQPNTHIRLRGQSVNTTTYTYTSDIIQCTTSTSDIRQCTTSETSQWTPQHTPQCEPRQPEAAVEVCRESAEDYIHIRDHAMHNLHIRYQAVHNHHIRYQAVLSTSSTSDVKRPRFDMEWCTYGHMDNSTPYVYTRMYTPVHITTETKHKSTTTSGSTSDYTHMNTCLHHNIWYKQHFTPIHIKYNSVHNTTSTSTSEASQ